MYLLLKFAKAVMLAEDYLLLSLNLVWIFYGLSYDDTFTADALVSDTDFCSSRYGFVSYAY